MTRPRPRQFGDALNWPAEPQLESARWWS